MLNKKELYELVSIANQQINLPLAVLEKDYYVTQAIHAIAGLENEYFRLVFCGGTCLSKAHKLVKRMSEDIDFKICTKQDARKFSKSKLLKELKEFRKKIFSLLSTTNLSISDFAVRNEGKYSRVELTYPILFETNNILRPHLLLEFTLADVRLGTESLNIQTIIEETIKIPKIFSSLSVECVCVDETAVEKWVGLTRRVVAIERQYHFDDKTLIRHVYDLNSIKKADKISDAFYGLSKVIIENDAAQFKNQHPEYSDNPAAEITRSLMLLKESVLWKSRYEEFINSMVYEIESAQPYEKAIQIIEQLSLKAFA